jgi:hypothetical protein
LNHTSIAPKMHKTEIQDVTLTLQKLTLTTDCSLRLKI